MRHHYHPLQEGYIRVLLLHPGEPHDDIMVSMEAVRLDQAPQHVQYEALSYVWGDDPALCPVYLFDMTRGENYRKITEDGDKPIEEQFCRIFEHLSMFPVRRSLYTALHRLRKRPPRNGANLDYKNWWRSAYTRVLWVDSICMNQRDSTEKNMQLPRMAEIYNKAQNVCIWLGEANPMSVISMDFISELAQPPIDDGMVNNLVDQKKLLAFLSLMRNRWFGRRWILQELFYAENARVYFGEKEQDWKMFFIALGRALELLQEQSGRSSPLDSLDPISQETLNAYGATVLRSLLFSEVLRKDRYGIPRATKSLDWLISKLTPFDAGDPRDILFSVYNLAKPDSMVPVPPTDYNSSVLDVFTRFVEYSWQLGNGLDMCLKCWVPVHTWHWLNLNKHDRRRVDTVLPSWMRTLDKSAFGIPSEIFGGRINGDSFVGDTDPVFKASGRQMGSAVFGKRQQMKLQQSEPTPSEPWPPAAPQIVLREEYDGSLQVEGQIIGVVHERSDRMLPEIIPRDVLQMGGWKQSDASEKLNLDDVPESLWRTLIAARASKSGHNIDDHSACLGMLRFQDRAGDIRIDSMLRGSLRSKVDRWLKDYLERARVACWNRRAMLVEPDSDHCTDGAPRDNMIFGIGPDEVRVGDIVTLIYGCSAPVILRKVDTKPNVGFSVRNPYKRQEAVPTPAPTPHEQASDPFEVTNGVPQPTRSPSPSSRGHIDTEDQPELWIIVGECYADGIMEGEAVDEQRSRKFTLV